MNVAILAAGSHATSSGATAQFLSRRFGNSCFRVSVSAALPRHGLRVEHDHFDKELSEVTTPLKRQGFVTENSVPTSQETLRSFDK
jgi:hypothetical protein